MSAADGWWLERLNPLSKLAATFPAIIVLVFVRDLATPIVFAALALAAVLTGVRPTRLVAIALTVVPVFVVVMAFGLGLWTDQSRFTDTGVLLQLGDFVYRTGALHAGFETSARLGAIGYLALVGGLSSTGPDLVRSAVRYLHLPYRVGYTALAAYRFVPRFAHELELIRAAHRVRGLAGGRGPIAGLRRWGGYVIPLLAGAIRHAERVALAMDARAFGAHPTRTERHEVPFRARDRATIAVGVLLTVAVPLTAPALLTL